MRRVFPMNAGLFVLLIYGVIFFFFSLAVSYYISPVSGELSRLLGAVDVPDGKRKLHLFPAGRLGGFSIMTALFIPCLCGGFFGVKSLFPIFIGGALIFFMGLCDDIFSLSAAKKLFVQISAALILFFGNYGIKSISIFGDSVSLGALSLPSTVIFVVLITNSFNLIDGIDGLSGGCGAITAFFLSVLMLFTKNKELYCISASLCGSCIGFLPHNFKEKKLFLGDCGAQLIGFMISAVALNAFSGELPFFAIIMTLLYPASETASSFFGRILKHRSPLSADRGHFHYRLVDSGLDCGETALYLLSTDIFFKMAGICLVFGGYLGFVLFIIPAGIAICFGHKLLFFEKLKNAAWKRSEEVANNIDKRKASSENC